MEVLGARSISTFSSLRKHSREGGGVVVPNEFPRGQSASCLSVHGHSQAAIAVLRSKDGGKILLLKNICTSSTRI